MARNAKKQRRKVTVRWSRARRRWILKIDAEPVKDTFRLKLFALGAARALCRDFHSNGELAQLVVFKRNGQIQTEHTYGDDPVETKG